MAFTLEQIHDAAQKAGINSEQISQLEDCLGGAPDNLGALTVLCNEGIHPIPRDHLPGRVYTATVGNISDQSPNELSTAIAEACRGVAHLLKQEGPFLEVYLVPSGYSLLLQKLAEVIIQITGKPATTLHFDRHSGSYWPIRIDLRQLIAEA